MTELDFKISSGLKNIIGKELITNDLIAIFELVKNSYDANAKNSKIIFENIKPENSKKGSRIIILDDGDGMSLDDLTNKWLFIAYSDKKNEEQDLDKENDNFRNKQQKRIFAGAKGIGRFSCDRLGSELNLITKKSHEKLYSKLYTNWSKFEEDTKKELQTIKVDYHQIENFTEEELEGIEDFKNGTLLEIYSLNSEWDRDKLLKLKRYLQRLINPIQSGDEPEFQIFLEAKEFLPDDEKNRTKGDFQIVNGVIKNIIFEKLGIKTTQLNCSIDEDGKNIFTELIDKGEFIFSLEEKNVFKKLKNINIKLFYLNTEAKKAFKREMGISPVQYGSISLYKNRFRIHPYGDENDDWLGLERRKTQGYARFLATRELMGRIEINGRQPYFKEVSSRDGGIIKNDNFMELIEFFETKALKRLEKYVVEGIGWESEKSILKDPAQVKADSIKLIQELVGQVKDPDKKIKYNENLLSIIQKKQIESLPELIKNIETAKKFIQHPEQAEYIDNQIKAVKTATQSITSDLKKTESELSILKKDFKDTEDEVIFLRGITSEETKEIVALQHQIGISLGNIGNYLTFLKTRVEKSRLISPSEILEVVDQISLEVKKINMIIKIVTKAKFDLERDQVPLELVSFIKQYIENVYLQLKEMIVDNKNVKVTVIPEDNFKLKGLIRPLDYAIIFDNLINNSIKAGSKNIQIFLERYGKSGIKITITDDGKGIPEENIEKIFNLGFTTTDGSGIGLYHVAEIVKKIDGTIFVNKSVEKGAEFIIVIEYIPVEEP